MIEHNLISEYPHEYKKFIHELTIEKMKNLSLIAYNESRPTTPTNSVVDGFYFCRKVCESSSSIIEYLKQNHSDETLDDSILICDTIIDFTKRFKAELQTLKAQQ